MTRRGSLTAHTEARPCPICRSYSKAKSGFRRRCHGGVSSDGTICACSVAEFAGLLLPTRDSTYLHHLDGQLCGCGRIHAEAVRRPKSV